MHNQSTWQIYAPPPKNITRASYEQISHPNCVHQAVILFLTHDHYKGKTYISLLNLIDCASRYKASVPLISKKSSEVAKAFKKIYNDLNDPLTYPVLLLVDGGKEYMGKIVQLMKDHNVIIQVIGAYSHRGLAFVNRFNKTQSEILYKVQYAVETISSDPILIRVLVKHVPEVNNYLNNYPTRLIRAPRFSKWGLVPSKAIMLEKIESKLSISRKRAIEKDEEKLKKGDTVRYLLANGE